MDQVGVTAHLAADERHFLQEEVRQHLEIHVEEELRGRHVGAVAALVRPGVEHLVGAGQPGRVCRASGRGDPDLSGMHIMLVSILFLGKVFVWKV